MFLFIFIYLSKYSVEFPIITYVLLAVNNYIIINIVSLTFIIMYIYILILGRNSGGGMASMMDEMAKTLARRRAQVEKKPPPEVINDFYLTSKLLLEK